MVLLSSARQPPRCVRVSARYAAPAPKLHAEHILCVGVARERRGQRELIGNVVVFSLVGSARRVGRFDRVAR